ncbi:MAG: hypothetical protein Q7U20_03035 [Caulobacter sp.]|nr:hypothetical protein [Caulobacter sp.]
MRVFPLLAVAGLALAACSPTAPRGADQSVMDQAVSKAIGDPNTCVLVLKPGTAEVVYRYGSFATCGRILPACSTPGTLTAEALGKAAAAGDVRAASCDTLADGSRRVGWASGPVPQTEAAEHDPLVYAAVMEGPSVLPGREIKARLEPALVRAGM